MASKMAKIEPQSSQVALKVPQPAHLGHETCEMPELLVTGINLAADGALDILPKQHEPLLCKYAGMAAKVVCRGLNQMGC